MNNMESSLISSYDLHSHSDVSSDGIYSPVEVAGLMSEAGIQLFSLTDHNRIEGLDQIFNSSTNFGISLVTGCEFSTYYDGVDIHLLAYGFDMLDENISNCIAKYNERAKTLTVRRVEKLQKLGFRVDVDDVLSAIGDRPTSGVAVLKVVEKNPANYHLIEDYFKGSKAASPYTSFHLDYFVKGGKAYVDMELLDFEYAVSSLRDCSLLSIAHPGIYPKGCVEQLLASGVDGIEAYSPYHADEDIEYFLSLCSSHGLIPTAGSDFHGEAVKPGIKPGMLKQAPMSVLDGFMDKLEEKCLKVRKI